MQVRQGQWVAVWAAMPQLTEEENMPPPPFNEPSAAFRNATIRQTLRVTAGASHLRICLSNAFGLTNLDITAATVALPRPKPGHGDDSGSSCCAGAKGVVAESLQALTFGGQPSVSLPNGASAISDPVAFPVRPGQVISVSLFLRDGQAGGHITSHPGSRTRSWICRGDHTAAAELAESPETALRSVLHWYFLSGILAWQGGEEGGGNGRRTGALVLLGDSITDGRCSTDDGNDRWPDLLLDRIISARPPSARHHVSILNLAAGGNRVLADGLGPCLLGRLDRDVFAQPGARYVFVFHGVNDIGTAEPDAAAQAAVGAALMAAYRQIVARAHVLGLPVFASTIGPFGGNADNYAAAATREQTRQRVNGWIRTAGLFDAVVDFDALLRDPHRPGFLRPEYDSGDGLHPNVVAFRAMADAFPLGVLDEYAGGVGELE